MAGPRSTVQTLPVDNLTAENEPDSEFSRSGFIQRETLTGLQKTESSFLNGQICMIFHPSRFPSEYDHARLTTALRLATEMLLVALPFFHAMFSYDKVKPNLDPQYVGRWMFPEPLDTLTSEQEKFTWARLMEMGKHLRYALRGRDGDGVSASTLPRYEHGVTLDLGLKGTGTNLFITQSMYNALLHAQSDPSDIIRQQTGEFIFATTLVHELVHAGFFASVPVQYHGLRFFVGENGQTTEHGYELEVWLFGGVIPEPACFTKYRYYHDHDRGRPSQLSGMLVVTQWPCPSRCLMYQKSGMPVAVRGDLARVEVVWNARFSDFNNFFQDSFWKEDVCSQGRKALFFPQETACRFQPRGDAETRQPLARTLPFERMGVPRGYFVDGLGLVRREKVVEKKKKKEGLKVSSVAGSLMRTLSARVGKKM